MARGPIGGFPVHWFASAFALLLAVAGARPAFGQASLAAEDQIEQVPVTINGVKESFTIVRDARNKKQFYYMPDRPRLFERSVEGKIEPEFDYVKYQFRDPEKPESFLEGAVIQFAASLDIPADALPQLKQAISQLAKVEPNDIQLGPLPMKAATVDVYTMSGEFLGSATQGTGVAPTMANQKMVFVLQLKQIGASVYRELIDGNTGIPVAVTFTYNGLTPPAGFYVEVDWDQTYKHYSRNDKFAAQANYHGLFGASANVDVQKISDELQKNNAMKVETYEGEGVDFKTLEPFLQPILARISTELSTNMQPPAKITPAVAGDPDPKGKFISAGYSMAMKKASDVRKGKERIDFKFHKMMERKTLAAGFVGIGRYPEDIRKKLVRTAGRAFESVFFLVPPVGNLAGVSEVTLESALKAGDRRFDAQLLRWDPKEGWQDRQGKTRRVVTFPMTTLHRELGAEKAKEAKFEHTIEITQGRNVIKLQREVPALEGESEAPSFGSEWISQATDVIEVDGSGLPFKALDPTSKLQAVRVAIANTQLRATLQPKNVNGQLVAPEPIYWLVKKTEQPIMPNVSFIFEGRGPVPWKNNNQDISANPFVFLDISDAQ